MNALRLTFATAIVSILLLASFSIVAPSLASDDNGGEIVEFSGTGFRVGVPGSGGFAISTLSDCGDEDESTNVIFLDSRETPPTNVWDGAIFGESIGMATALADGCFPVNDGGTHGNGRTIIIFEEATIAGRTGGLVIESLFDFEAGPCCFTDADLTFLCGTGELEGIHGGGQLVRTLSLQRHYQIWGHFGHDHETGSEFMCDGLGNDSDSD